MSGIDVEETVRILPPSMTKRFPGERLVRQGLRRDLKPRPIGVRRMDMTKVVISCSHVVVLLSTGGLSVTGSGNVMRIGKCIVQGNLSP